MKIQFWEERGGGRLQWGFTTLPPNPPAAKFASQGDARMRTDAQINFLHYPLVLSKEFEKTVLEKVKDANFLVLNHQLL